MNDRGARDVSFRVDTLIAAWENLRWWLEDAFEALRAGADAWCRSRDGWWLRAVFSLYLLYAGLRTLADPSYATAFGGLTFALHELGHVLCSWFGEGCMIAGGTGLQLFAPMAAGFHLIWTQRDYFGLCVCVSWLGFSLHDASVYIGDARAQALPLIGLGDNVIHDWHYLLSRAGLLEWDGVLASAVAGVGVLAWATSCAAAVWLCWRIRAHRATRFTLFKRPGP